MLSIFNNLYFIKHQPIRKILSMNTKAGLPLFKVSYSWYLGPKDFKTFNQNYILKTFALEINALLYLPSSFMCFLFIKKGLTNMFTEIISKLCFHY